jgi:hypothetical protein
MQRIAMVAIDWMAPLFDGLRASGVRFLLASLSRFTHPTIGTPKAVGWV